MPTEAACKPAASPLLEVARDVLAIEAEALSLARARLDGGFVNAAQLILERCPPGKVVVMGVGKSGHVGNKIAATLASTGTPAFFVHPTEAGHGDLGMVTPDDVVLGISYSGKTDELLRLIPYFKRNSVPMIALTGRADSPLADYADVCIEANVDREACPLGLAPTASTTLALALGDALAVCLLKERGFTPDDFAVTHPHGSLGRKLLVTVGDIMLEGDEVPRVSDTTTIRESLVEMSRGGIGITSVVDAEGRLLGIFTDGDLRRSLDHNVNIHTTPIGDVMTVRPRTLTAQQIAAQAAEAMERYKVSAFVVVDAGNRVVGALNMRILLRAGVV